MFFDPYLTRFAPIVCQTSGPWSFHELLPIADEALNILGGSIEESTPVETASEATEEDELVIHLGNGTCNLASMALAYSADNVAAFHTLSRGQVPIGLGDRRDLVNMVSLEAILKCLSTYDPLRHWSDTFTSPRIRCLNLTTLAYVSSTAFQESVFSVAKRIATPERNRLKDQVLEALLVLNVRIARAKLKKVFTFGDPSVIARIMTAGDEPGDPDPLMDNGTEQVSSDAGLTVML